MVYFVDIHRVVEKFQNFFGIQTRVSCKKFRFDIPIFAFMWYNRQMHGTFKWKVGVSLRHVCHVAHNLIKK